MSGGGVSDDVPYVEGACPVCGSSGKEECRIQRAMDVKAATGAWAGRWTRYAPEFLRLWYREYRAAVAGRES